MLSDDCIKSAIALLQPRRVLHNSDIRAAIARLTTALHVREAESTNAALLAAYDQYFDQCQLYNRSALSFDDWRTTNTKPPPSKGACWY